MVGNPSSHTVSLVRTYILISFSISCCTHLTSGELGSSRRAPNPRPWSPMVSGRAVFPPVVGQENVTAVTTNSNAVFVVLADNQTTRSTDKRRLALVTTGGGYWSQRPTVHNDVRRPDAKSARPVVAVASPPATAAVRMPHTTTGVGNEAVGGVGVTDRVPAISHIENIVTANFHEQFDFEPPATFSVPSSDFTTTDESEQSDRGPPSASLSVVEGSTTGYRANGGDSDIVIGEADSDSENDNNMVPQVFHTTEPIFVSTGPTEVPVGIGGSDERATDESWWWDDDEEGSELFTGAGEFFPPEMLDDNNIWLDEEEEDDEIEVEDEDEVVNEVASRAENEYIIPPMDVRVRHHSRPLGAVRQQPAGVGFQSNHGVHAAGVNNFVPKHARYSPSWGIRPPPQPSYRKYSAEVSDGLIGGHNYNPYYRPINWRRRRRRRRKRRKQQPASWTAAGLESSVSTEYKLPANNGGGGLAYPRVAAGSGGGALVRSPYVAGGSGDQSVWSWHGLSQMHAGGSPVSGQYRQFPVAGGGPLFPPARVMVEEGRDSNGGLVKSLRGMFGVPDHCLEDGIQYSCTLTPVCWVTGGIAGPGCDSMFYSCCKPPQLGRKKPDPIEKRGQEWIQQEPECGISRHRQFSKRIIGGDKAKFAELPWQVHIRISSYQCGGVLLNHWYIATAAHCVHRAKLNKITVHLGEYDTKDNEDEPLESQTYKVDHKIIHPEFRYMLTQPDRFDVALLHLDRPVFYQENIIPICLPPSDIDLEGKVGLVAGWGKTDNSFGKTGTNILHKVMVPVINNDECIRWHEDKNILVQLHSEMFCAGHKNGKRDACLGDSGGPLIIHYDGRWTLIGITSAGFGCAVDKQPGIYHKIGRTADWIRSQIFI